MQKNTINIPFIFGKFIQAWVTALTVLGLLLGQASVAQAADGHFVALDRDGIAMEAKNSEFAGFSIPEKNGARKQALVQKEYRMDVTAYTSSVEECDSDPFITADGSTTHDGVIATNVLPFGTKVKIPDYFGDKIFTVHDRMNARYSYRVDIWMEHRQDMHQWGLKKNARIEIVEMGDGKTQWAARAAAMKAEREAKKLAESTK
jgi:3D (Asp-Asp-Asp) domain-containing protein